MTYMFVSYLCNLTCKLNSRGVHRHTRIQLKLGLAVERTNILSVLCFIVGYLGVTKTHPENKCRAKKKTKNFSTQEDRQYSLKICLRGISHYFIFERQSVQALCEFGYGKNVFTLFMEINCVFVKDIFQGQPRILFVAMTLFTKKNTCADRIEYVIFVLNQ